MKIALLILLIVLFFLTIFNFRFLSSRFTALGVTLNLLIPEGKWRPLNLITKHPVLDEYSIESRSGRNLRIHVYKPSQDLSRSVSVIVIYTPLIGDGLEDSRLINLASTFTRAGFVVVVPWNDEDRLALSTRDIQDVVSTVEFTTNELDININKLGLFGLSYGNGPVIAAASHESIKSNVDFIISFAGFYDLNNLLDFIETGIFSYKDIKGTLVIDPYANKVLETTLNYYETDLSGFLVREDLIGLIRDLSPASYANELDVDFLITHSTDDRVVPYTESMRLAESVSENMVAPLSLTDVFEHGEYKELNWDSFWNTYVSSFDNFYQLLVIVMSKYR